MRQRDVGCTYAYCKSDGSAYALPRSEFARLKHEWTAGRAFFEGQSLYGAQITLKLGDIVAVSDVTAEQMRLQREDRRADEQDDKADEMLTGA